MCVRWRVVLSYNAFLPNRTAGQHSTSNEHSDVHRGGLYDTANCDDNGCQLHKANTSQSVSDPTQRKLVSARDGDLRTTNVLTSHVQDLDQSPNRFSGDVSRDDLSVGQSVCSHLSAALG